jgi:hypothetical protein
MNIHDKARQIVAQSPRPMELRDAYARLSRRRDYGRVTVKPSTATANIESPRPQIRLPYADN